MFKTAAAKFLDKISKAKTPDVNPREAVLAIFGIATNEVGKIRVTRVASKAEYAQIYFLLGWNPDFRAEEEVTDYTLKGKAAKELLKTELEAIAAGGDIDLGEIDALYRLASKMKVAVYRNIAIAAAIIVAGSVAAYLVVNNGDDYDPDCDDCEDADPEGEESEGEGE